VFKFSIADR